jgi:uncharacterized protein YkvS
MISVTNILYDVLQCAVNKMTNTIFDDVLWGIVNKMANNSILLSQELIPELMQEKNIIWESFVIA